MCFKLIRFDLYYSHSSFLNAYSNWNNRPPTRTVGISSGTPPSVFTISIACTVGFPHVLYVPVEYMNAGNAQQGYFVFFFFGPTIFLPSLALSLFPSPTPPLLPCLLCVSAWKWNRSFWILSSITEKAPLLVMQSGAKKKKKKAQEYGMSPARWFREEECSILYAGRISLIEVSAWENCGCVRVNVWV